MAIPFGTSIGAGIGPEQLNDDLLGRTQDSLYAYDVTALFSVVSAQACQRLGLLGGRVHLDSTSFHVDGAYAAAEQDSVVTL